MQLHQGADPYVPRLAETLQAPVSAIPDKPIFSNGVRLSHLAAQTAIDCKANVPCPFAVDDFPLSFQHRRVIVLWSTGQRCQTLAMQVQVGSDSNRDTREELEGRNVGQKATVKTPRMLLTQALSCS